jgi:hypothetical protein
VGGTRGPATTAAKAVETVECFGVLGNAMHYPPPPRGRKKGPPNFSTAASSPRNSKLVRSGCIDHSRLMQGSDKLNRLTAWHTHSDPARHAICTSSRRSGVCLVYTASIPRTSRDRCNGTAIKTAGDHKYLRDFVLASRGLCRCTLPDALPDALPDTFPDAFLTHSHLKLIPNVTLCSV